MLSTDSGMLSTDSGMLSTDSEMLSTDSGMLSTDSGILSTGGLIYLWSGVESLQNDFVYSLIRTAKCQSLFDDMLLTFLSGLYFD